MNSCINRLSILAGFIIFFTTITLAGQPAGLASSIEDDFSATVTMANDVQVSVEKIRLQESPGGQWITTRPNRYASEMYFRINKDGVTIRRVLPFDTIATIEFSTSLGSDAMYPEVRRMLIKLKDGGTIEWVHADRSVTISSSGGKTERWNSFPWITGVVSSEEKEQGQNYVITGFTGVANANGEQGKWEAKPTEIKRIQFIDGLAKKH